MRDFVESRLAFSRAGDLWNDKHGAVIKPAAVGHDEDPLLEDEVFLHFAKARGKGYPTIPPVSLPADWITLDDPMPFPDQLVTRIGQDGWNYVDKVTAYVAFEIDLKGPGHDKGATAEQIEQFDAASAQVNYVENRHSTGGEGRHIRVWLTTPIPSPERRDYAATIQRVVDILSDDVKELLPFPLRSILDGTVLGRGNLWIWSDNMNDRSFKVISAATETLELGDWRPTHGIADVKERRGQGFDIEGVLKRNGVKILGTKQVDWADGGTAYFVPCTNGPHEGGDTKTMVGTKNGVPFHKCFADKCKKRRWKEFAADAMPDDPNAVITAGASNVIQVVYFATKLDGFFHTNEGETYVDVLINGQTETLDLEGTLYAAVLRNRYRAETGSSIGETQLKQAVKELQAFALLHAPKREVFRRIAKVGDNYYLDLCDPERNVVEINKHGWRVRPSTEVDVRFIRPPKFLPIPAPVRGGDISLLWKFLNISEEDRPLVVGWLLAALRPDIACPLLLFTGQAGSGKTSAFQFVAALISPLANDEGKLFTLARMPRSEQDLFVAARNGHIYAVDNVSAIPKPMSDAWCALITGAADEGRKFYTNAGEHRMTVRRPSAMTAVGQVVTETDLQDRTLFVDVPQLTGKRSDAELWAAFDAERAQILGALLDAFVIGLNNKAEIAPVDMPRMVDFAQFAVSAETSFGFQPGTFIKAMRRTQRTMAEGSVEESSLARAIVTLASAETFTGTSTQLIEKLGPGDWPSNARKFSSAFAEIIPALEKVGVRVTKRTLKGKTNWTIAA